ncbi:hypothetical protein [Streptomyces lydicus]|uniref:hypothetical protein n=1 Tax=Streptomyces lydicus TaxID=47763 RepID=UPI0010128B5F|nr:hypothetical protein [Streptomyces lydicus]MCZ1011907.1 hypothetical protein [Streptomyces lydicus]
MASCWVHLSEEERESCTRARGLRNAEQARIWAEGEPERQRRAAEAAAERRARLAACPCAEQLPEEAGTRSTGYPAPSRCKGCDSWLCASCDRVRVAAEGAQCDTCRPQPAQPSLCSGHAEEDGPYYRIRVGSLECFAAAIGLVIRAGAHNGGDRREFAVHLPVCESQATALEALKAFDLGSDRGSITVELVPDGAEAVVDPGLPEPDLSGLGDIDGWWSANAYPAGNRRRRPR